MASLLDSELLVDPFDLGIGMLGPGHPQNDIMVIMQSGQIKVERFRVSSNLQVEELSLGSTGFLGSAICQSNR